MNSADIAAGQSARSLGTHEASVFLQVGTDQGWQPLSEARVPVLDRGFIFGDGVYEVVPVYEAVPFRLNQHLTRLARSLNAVAIANPFDTQRWKELIAEAVQRNQVPDQLVYMQVTRGVAKRAHAFPAGLSPTVFIMSNPLPVVPEAQRRAGVRAVTAVDNRWLRCDIKSTSLLGNVLMAQYAAEHEAVETIMLRDGLLTEGSSTNVWVVHDRVLLAPPRDERILEGIRYGLLAELAATHDLTLEIRPITAAELHAADEVLLSSASKEVLAVSRIDGRAVGAGVPGPVYEALYQWYQEAKRASIAAARAGGH